MKNKKLLVIYLFLLFFISSLIANENTVLVKPITVNDFELNYNANKNTINNVLTDKQINSPIQYLQLYEIKISDVGYIVFTKITVGTLPFLQSYSIEFYYDNYRNFICSNFVDYSNTITEETQLPIQIDSDGIGTNCEFE